MDLLLLADSPAKPKDPGPHQLCQAVLQSLPENADMDAFMSHLLLAARPGEVLREEKALADLCAITRVSGESLLGFKARVIELVLDSGLLSSLAETPAGAALIALRALRGVGLSRTQFADVLGKYASLSSLTLEIAFKAIQSGPFWDPATCNPCAPELNTSSTPPTMADRLVAHATTVKSAPKPPAKPHKAAARAASRSSSSSSTPAPCAHCGDPGHPTLTCRALRDKLGLSRTGDFPADTCRGCGVAGARLGRAPDGTPNIAEWVAATIARNPAKHKLADCPGARDNLKFAIAWPARSPRSSPA
jgi:hypothetical protein